mmetsp:Transcript_65027/g.167370  ORF Transcript_65027/g.167370 Transcript_65027/m.167370 type:complete len:238 (-) Transcript_65027:742-1455(-)
MNKASAMMKPAAMRPAPDADSADLAAGTRPTLSSMTSNFAAGAAAAPWKVEPIGPNLTSVNVTKAFLSCLCRSFALPDSKEQGPRMTPGSFVSSVITSLLPSSQSMRLRLSSQTEKVSTMPRSSAWPMDARPPFLGNVYVVSLKTLACVSQNASVTESPPFGMFIAFALSMTLPSWTQTRRISFSTPASVPSEVMNCVTRVTGLEVSTAFVGPWPKKFLLPRRYALKSHPSLSQSLM